MTRLGFEILTYQNKIHMRKDTKKQNSTNTQMGYDTVLYAVLKLLTLVEVQDLAGDKHKVKISGAEGYIPVFATKEEAEIEACDGKYQIFAMSVPK
ncbi:hypothetical protein EP331_00155 [bacterium]|nr:MAG: hypothetical protein EP331_00155 [bacterium]